MTARWSFKENSPTGVTLPLCNPRWCPVAYRRNIRLLARHTERLQPPRLTLTVPPHLPIHLQTLCSCHTRFPKPWLSLHTLCPLPTALPSSSTSALDAPLSCPCLGTASLAHVGGAEEAVWGLTVLECCFHPCFSACAMGGLTRLSAPADRCCRDRRQSSWHHRGPRPAQSQTWRGSGNSARCLSEWMSVNEWKYHLAQCHRNLECKAAFSPSLEHDPLTQSHFLSTTRWEKDAVSEKSLGLWRGWALSQTDPGVLPLPPASQAQHPLAPISTSCALVRPQLSTLKVCTIGA